LAVELARKYNGEIINGDAMQLYEGLPIITNKITKDEMKNIPHHLLGCVGLREETWTVGKFVNEALSTVCKSGFLVSSLS
jgi:tRNA dimethylallyltransferase